MTTIREWRNEEWERGGTARAQEDLQRMAKKIIANAEIVENIAAVCGNQDGQPFENLGRVLTCTSSLMPDTKYIIHVYGFTVENIIETVKS